MKTPFVWFVTAFLGYAVCTSSAFSQKAKAKEESKPEGKKIFAENKCASCHTIESIGIKRKEGEPKPADMKPPDLSTIGSERSSEWIMKYLQKKETISGEKHPKKFKGNDEELAALAKWLETLKAENKKGEDK